MRKCCTSFPQGAVRIAVACAAAFLGWQLLRGARDPDISVADVRRLAGYGSAGVPALVRILETRDTTLDKLSQMAWPGLPASWNPNRRMQNRAAAAQALGGLGPAARSALPALRKALEDPSAEVADSAQLAISQITGTSPGNNP